MMLAALALLIAAQAGAAPPVERDRLQVCLDLARRDPATGIVRASEWLGEANGAEQALPHQCLGQAYVSLLRWDAALEAFRTARDLAAEPVERARLGGMAGNAALAAERLDEALTLLVGAGNEALAAGEAELSGSLAADRSRALVGLDRAGEAAAALEEARRLAPQNAEGWLLSATLARRQGDLDRARDYIAAAATLAAEDPRVALEAGVIAILRGEDEAARRNWAAVRALAPDSAEAETARGYLAQLDGGRS